MTALSIVSRAARQPRIDAVLSWIASPWRRFAQFCDRRHAIRTLQGLDDHELRDIGITRCRIAQVINGEFDPHGQERQP